jgi:hypothetical protein
LVRKGLAFYHYSISSIFAIKAKQIINHSYQFSNLMWAIILIRIKKKQVSIVLLLCAIVECNMAASFFIFLIFVLSFGPDSNMLLLIIAARSICSRVKFRVLHLFMVWFLFSVKLFWFRLSFYVAFGWHSQFIYLVLHYCFFGWKYGMEELDELAFLCKSTRLPALN